MKSNIHLIYTSILFGLIVFCSVEYHNNNALETRINSLNKNSIDFNSDKTFKEDYYITQQSRDTNLMLVLFPILVAVSGYFTYINVSERYSYRIRKVEEDYNNQKSEWIRYYNKLILLESELNYQIGISLSEKANGDIKPSFLSCIMDSICAMQKFASSICAEDSDSNNKQTLKILCFELQSLNDRIGDNDTYHFDLDFKIYNERIEIIRKVLNQDGLQVLNRITSKIIFN
ncbi:hypothetical protein [Flavobacterium sp. Arc2]|uniref:hypothetical protein n=1 Tax=Flavobacterium sp. Arc2 TaxID=3046685 RepID=UPI00352BD6DD